MKRFQVAGAVDVGSRSTRMSSVESSVGQLGDVLMTRSHGAVLGDEQRVPTSRMSIVRL